MIGRTIGKYRIVGQLGRGGAGIVYKAVDETLNRDVAVKALNPDLANTEVMSRFQAEATILARLNHPQIATIYELFRSETDLLMVMEFVRGEALDKLSDRLGPIAPDRAAYLIDLILSALEHAHRAGIVHRDVKPANVMVTHEGGVKIMDFGIARVLGAEQKTVDGRLMGTPAYMAPEQVLAQEVDARADLYSVGVLFYRLLSGALPFTADTALGMLQRQVRDIPMPLHTHRPDLPEWCDRIVQRALAKSAADRYQSAEEFREAINHATGPLPAAELARTFEMVDQVAAPGVAVAGDTVVLAPGEMVAGAPVRPAAPAPAAVALTRMAWVVPGFAVVAIGVIAIGYAVLRLSSTEAVIVVRPPAETTIPSAEAALPTVNETPVVGRGALATAPSRDPESESTEVSATPIVSEPVEDPEPPATKIAAAEPREIVEPRVARLASSAHEPSLVFETKALVGTRKTREQSAQLVLGDGKITVIPQEDPTSRLCDIPYERVISISVSHGRDPLWNSPQGPAPVARAGGALGKFGISITRDWIALRTSTEEQFVAMRFDEVLLKRVLLVLEERTGRTAEQVIEERKGVKK